MAMFWRRAYRVARGPVGRRVAREAVKFAQKPENRRKVAELRRRVASRHR